MVNVSANAIQTLNFGGIVQAANYNTVAMRVTDGNAIWLRCMKSGAEPELGQISFESPMDDGYDTLIIKPTIASEVNIAADCSIKVKNLALSAAAKSLTTSVKTQTFDIGGNLEIEGFCGANVYHGSVNVDYSVQKTDSTELKAGSLSLPIMLEIKSNANITRDNDMSFGTIISNGGSGMVLLGTDDNITYTDGVLKVIGPTTAGQISIYGTPNLQITGVDYQSAVSICLNGNSNSGSCMIVDSFTRTPDGMFRLDESRNSQGYKMLRLGGTLHVNENQPIGEYSGILNVTISY
jgi:hypothetical protein